MILLSIAVQHKSVISPSSHNPYLLAGNRQEEGRALLYVKTYGLDRVKDLVLNACLHDLSYDSQIEGSRAKWLFAMFVDSPDYLEFRAAILAAMVVEEKTWVLLQLCGLAKEMALKGDSIAEQALVDRVYCQANLRDQQYGDDSIIEDWIGVNESIEVRGIDALLELSRIYGRRLLANPTDRVMDDLQIFTDKSAEIVEVFEEYAKVEESIAVYYQYLIDRQVFMVRIQVLEAILRETFISPNSRR